MANQLVLADVDMADLDMADVDTPLWLRLAGDQGGD